jgi:hypothetical protein
MAKRKYKKDLNISTDSELGIVTNSGLNDNWTTNRTPDNLEAVKVSHKRKRKKRVGNAAKNDKGTVKT